MIHYVFRAVRRRLLHFFCNFFRLQKLWSHCGVLYSTNSEPFYEFQVLWGTNGVHPCDTISSIQFPTPHKFLEVFLILSWYFISATSRYRWWATEKCCIILIYAFKTSPKWFAEINMYSNFISKINQIYGCPISGLLCLHANPTQIFSAFCWPFHIHCII